ncbi:MAG TPA: hypothetical protein DCQ79_12545 [Rhizobiales bacterium]|jgi:hypothetical protein|nr:hypothetical protein [Hyphomicrobiales bacterium]
MLNCAHLENERKGAAACRPSFARYAIYFTPQPGTALAAFGRSWFGRANDGITLQAFSDAGLSGTSFAKIAAAPGRYTGLHALFRAPFALRDGMGPEALKSRLITFAARRKPVETGPLTLSRAGRFLVLRPVEATPALEWLAAQCVGAFEDFAAPPSDTEREEHASPHLSDYQRLLLESFGDPFVLSEYRFAITLTGPLDAAHLERVAQALWPVLEEICASGVTVDGLSLFGDPGGRTPMRLVGRYRLGA